MERKRGRRSRCIFPRDKKENWGRSNAEEGVDTSRRAAPRPGGAHGPRWASGAQRLTPRRPARSARSHWRRPRRAQRRRLAHTVVSAPGACADDQRGALRSAQACGLTVDPVAFFLTMPSGVRWPLPWWITQDARFILGDMNTLTRSWTDAAEEEAPPLLDLEQGGQQGSPFGLLSYVWHLATAHPAHSATSAA